MDLACGYRAKTHNGNKHLQSPRGGLNPNTLLVIKLPDSKFLRILSRSLCLAIVILTVPCIRSIIRGPSGSLFNAIDYHQDSGFINLSFLNILWQDMCNEGLIKKGHKALILSSAIEGVSGDYRFLNSNDNDVMIESDLQRQKSLPAAAFDFVFLFGSHVDAKFVDRVVKTEGIVAMQLSNDVSSVYQKQSNYKIVYLRRYTSTIVAMRKTGPTHRLEDSSTKRRLCQLAPEARKAILKDLEDVLLEPPRRAISQSQKYLKTIKFLPELLGDSLDKHPRRIFINVGYPEEKNGVMKWFDENYPKSKQKFEVYSLEMVSGEEARRVTPWVDVSNWLMKNVGEEEYVVMKAEAAVVEDLIERRTICLVDELFLECNNQWQEGVEKRKKSRRAYWECLALYGKLRDEGVAVHQWWG